MWYPTDKAGRAKVIEEGLLVHFDITNKQYPLKKVRFFIDFFQQASSPVAGSPEPPLPEGTLPKWGFVVPHQGVCRSLEGAQLEPGTTVKSYVYKAPEEWLPVSDGPLAVQATMDADATRRLTVELRPEPASSAKTGPHLPRLDHSLPIIRASLSARVALTPALAIEPSPGAFAGALGRGVPSEFPAIAWSYA